MRRLLALVTVAMAVAFAAPAEAKPYTYSDPKDMPANAGLDIVGVTYSTTGITSTRKVGRKTVKTYEPTKLLATMTLAGAPVEQPGIKYRVDAQIESCGNLTFTYATGVASAALAFSQLSVGCGGAPGTTGGDTLFLDPQISVKGSKITWTISLKALPKVARAGALLYAFRSSVDLAEPATGTLGPEDVGDALLDTARSDDDWTIS